MIENTYLERERMGSSRTNVRIDLVTYPVCSAYGRCALELFRATVRARDVDLWVPSDGYPSYVSIPIVRIHTRPRVVRVRSLGLLPGFADGSEILFVSDTNR